MWGRDGQYGAAPCKTIGVFLTAFFASYSILRSGLAEYVHVVFCYEVGREETQQADDGEGKCYPVKACVERNAEDGSHKGQKCAQDKLIEGIGEKQYDQ